MDGVKVYEVKYDLLVDGQWGTFSDKRAVIVNDHEDARRAISKIETFIKNQRFGGARVEQIEIESVTLLARRALK